jgi:hypothetical protein
VAKGPDERGDLAEPEFKETGLMPAFSAETFQAGAGRIFLSGARADQVGVILPGARNSLFTTHLLDGLEREAADPDGYVRVFELFNYVQRRVRDAGVQRVMFSGQDIDEDFAVAFASISRSAEPPITKSPWKQDAFLSFSPNDREWVRDRLLPRLKAAGVSVATGSQFPLGDYHVLAIERAVQECKRVLLIVSEDSIRDRVQIVIGALAAARGMEAGQLALVPILIGRSRLPLRYSALVGLDFSRGEDEDQWDHLCQELRAELPII